MYSDGIENWPENFTCSRMWNEMNLVDKITAVTTAVVQSLPLFQTVIFRHSNMMFTLLTYLFKRCKVWYRHAHSQMSHASLDCMCLKLYCSFLFGEKKLWSLYCHKTEDTWWCKARSVNTCPAELWAFAGVQQGFTDVSVDLWLFQSGKEDVSSHLTQLPAQTPLCFVCEWHFSRKDLFLFLWCSNEAL